MDEILVSIWCIAYNHEAYIRDAIEGFLMQETDFRYEIVIHDDASTDKTAEIIREYEKKYPNLIHGIYQSENQWNKNYPSTEWIQAIEAQSCKGKYIACCEGDDYWIDRRKLQLQVNYLEKHPECIMTIHDAVDIDCRNYSIIGKQLYASKDCLIPPEEIITQKNLRVSTASMICRKEILKIDKFFLHTGIGDYPYLLYCLTKGSIFYFSRIMSVYRYCHVGAWSLSMTQNKEAHIIQLIYTIAFLKKYNKYFEHNYKDYVISKIQICVDDIINSLGKETLEYISEVCNKFDERTEKKYHNIFMQIIRIWQQIYNDNYLDDNMYHFICLHRKIVIMGAGKYAGIIAKQLKKNNIDFEGFVVSNDQQSSQYYMDKPVWKLKEIAFGLENIGIIIGINPTIWEQIQESLYCLDEENYMCPFLLDENI